MSNFSLVRGRAIRVTRLSGCGDPVLGPDSVVTSEGFISVGLTANQETGESISVTNAAGKVCILDEPAPKFVNYSVDVSFCGVNPELIGLMTGQPVRLSADGTEIVGFRVNSKVKVDKTGFALEMWSSVPTEECDDSGEQSYGYMLLPFLKGGTLGDFTVENGAVNFSMTGARSKDNPGWGAGPYDVVRDEDGAAGPLNEPVVVGDHLIVELTTVAPPDTDDDSGAALGVAAAGVTAGSPGTYTPGNSYGPANLTELQASSLGSGSAWTTGQYVTLRDGSTAHWTGTAWAAGAA